MKSNYPRRVKSHAASPHSKAAWGSALLTLSLLAGMTGLAHLLVMHRPRCQDTQAGIRIVCLSKHVPPPRPIPCPPPPAEQSTPQIDFVPPLLVAELVETPDIYTELSTPNTAFPILEAPESLHPPAPSRPVAVHQSPSVRKNNKPPTTATHPAAAITPPAYKAAPPPPYPTEMYASRARGCVRVRIEVDPTGCPTAVHITHSSGHRSFDTAASSWIMLYWRFIPAMCGDTPVASSVNTRVEFILDKA